MNVMYSIDSKHLIIKKSDGTTTHYNSSSEKYKPSNEYDLSNNNTYSENGELLKEAEQTDYDWQMAVKLHRISPIYRSRDFLNHHLEKTPDKKLFLEHIKYHILGFFGEPKQPLRKEFVLNWINEQEQLLKLSEKKPILSIIPETEIKRWRDQLIRGLVLTEDGENTNQIGQEKFRSKPLIALLIKDISQQFSLPETEVFKQVKSVWKLSAPALKNYKMPAESKIGDYEGYLDSITTQL